MTAIDYEAEYNNRRRVLEYAEIMERWQMLSAAYRLANAPGKRPAVRRRQAPALRPVRGQHRLGAAGGLHPRRLLAARRPQGLFVRGPRTERQRHLRRHPVLFAVPGRPR